MKKTVKKKETLSALGNHCYLTIKSYSGQHSQFLQCFTWTLPLKLVCYLMRRFITPKTWKIFSHTNRHVPPSSFMITFMLNDKKHQGVLLFTRCDKSLRFHGVSVVTHIRIWHRCSLVTFSTCFWASWTIGWGTLLYSWVTSCCRPRTATTGQRWHCGHWTGEKVWNTSGLIHKKVLPWYLARC